MAILTFLLQWSVWLELGKSVQKPLQNDSGLWRDFTRWPVAGVGMPFSPCTYHLLYLEIITDIIASKLPMTFLQEATKNLVENRLWGRAAGESLPHKSNRASVGYSPNGIIFRLLPCKIRNCNHSTCPHIVVMDATRKTRICDHKLSTWQRFVRTTANLKQWAGSI